MKYIFLVLLSLSLEEKAKREASEQEKRTMEEQIRVQEMLMDDQKRTHEEHKKQLLEKMEADKETAKVEYNRVLEAKLKVGTVIMETSRQYIDFGLRDSPLKIPNMIFQNSLYLTVLFTVCLHFSHLLHFELVFYFTKFCKILLASQPNNYDTVFFAVVTAWYFR